MIERFAEILSSKDALKSKDEEWHLKDEFSFTQCLISIA